MRKYIIDTDLGADSDDAAALMYMLGKMRKGECEISAITVCTARNGAAATAKAICSLFGYEIPIGKYSGIPLECDKTDNYAAEIAARYGETESENAVTLMRKTLAKNDETDVIAIGPLCNIAALLKSPADEFSPLCGKDLAKEKAGKFYVMGGSFFGNEKAMTDENFAEWNIEQDIESARYAAENIPNEVIFCPFETGVKVGTYLKSTFGVVREITELFFKNCDERSGIKYVTDENRARPSWDPLTCMVALRENDYAFSPFGKVVIDERGKTVFSENADGRHKYLLCQNDFPLAEKLLNDFLPGSRK